MDLITQKIEEWKRRLVDLTRRNRLLFFRRTRRSTLRIVEPLPGDVFDRLVNQEKAWQFYVPPETENEVARSEVDASNLVEENGSEGRPVSDPRGHRKLDELVTDMKDGTELRNSLRNLHRRSRTDLEERGVRILFITFGTLKWKEVDQSVIVESPILMVPVELKRESVNDPFELHPTEDEIVLNPALKVKLFNDFKVQVPELPDDWDEFTLQEYLNSFQAKVKSYGWDVNDECWVGLFSFHKLVIYHDLERHVDLLMLHPLIRALCGSNEPLPVIDAPHPEELDHKVDPKDAYLVADADSSQLVCIETVKAGGNLVIQGPPGTGKSQTITNLIGEFIARGKSLLFVSEKMAALEVVFQRLKDTNLEHFCFVRAHLNPHFFKHTPS